MRALVLCVLILAPGTAASDSETHPWSIRRFLRTHGFWEGFKPGSYVHFEHRRIRLRGMVFTGFDEVKEKLVRVTPKAYHFEVRRREHDREGKKSKWKKSKSMFQVAPKLKHRTEKTKEKTWPVGQEWDDVVVVQLVRIDPKWVEVKERWEIAWHQKHGLVEAKRLEPPGRSWKLIRLDVEKKVGKKTLHCRVYEHRAKIPMAFSKAERLWLHPSVPGYVVRSEPIEDIVFFRKRILVDFKKND